VRQQAGQRRHVTGQALAGSTNASLNNALMMLCMLQMSAPG